LPLDPVTQKRNEAVARLVAQDLDYSEVAEQLGCNSKTVSNVIRNYYPHLRRDPGRDEAVRRDRASGMTVKDVCAKYGLSKYRIWEICKKKQGE
jgi:DNA-binding CsgD family transcriptional regulator